MQASSARWHVVTDTEHAHERGGLEHVRELLPDRGPFQAWSNFEFVDSNGTWSEVHLLVLGEGTLSLVGLKHYQGDIGGNAYRWELVGVIGNLAVYFALHTPLDDTSRMTSGPLNFEKPHVESLQWVALAITVLGCALIFWRGWSVLRNPGSLCTRRH